MRSVQIACFTAPGTRFWTVDQDCLLQAVQCFAGVVVVSSDPSLTAAIFNAPPAENVRYDILCVASNVASSNTINPIPLKIPLAKGKRIYVANQSLTYAFLWLEDLIGNE